uniref:Uncharacterized protein n=1 Tax=Plectus sambesii TaxID=2011161 RepID=A0A914X8S5_9BILA
MPASLLLTEITVARLGPSVCLTLSASPVGPLPKAGAPPHLRYQSAASTPRRRQHHQQQSAVGRREPRAARSSARSRARLPARFVSANRKRPDLHSVINDLAKQNTACGAFAAASASRPA